MSYFAHIGASCLRVPISQYHGATPDSPHLRTAAAVLFGVSAVLTLTATSTGRCERGSSRSAADSARPSSGHEVVQCESKNAIATFRPRSEASENGLPNW